MYNFITADYHFGHTNIIRYCNRPFADIEEMDAQLIKFWNQRVKAEDTVYHLGDFCFRGGWQGGISKAEHYQSLLNGNIVFFKGNHDGNNGVKALMTSTLIEFAGYKIFLQHEPPTTRYEVPTEADFILCGHVHQMWKYKICSIEEYEDPLSMVVDAPIINVGVDVWNFKPVRMDEIVDFYNKINNEKWKIK